MKSALIITATLGSAMGASWSNDADVASATVGVGAGSADVAFVAAGANGTSFPWSYCFISMFTGSEGYADMN